jgi:hypothetical protein
LILLVLDFHQMGSVFPSSAFTCSSFLFGELVIQDRF